jgi:hypothetical protein
VACVQATRDITTPEGTNTGYLTILNSYTLCLVPAWRDRTCKEYCMCIEYRAQSSWWAALAYVTLARRFFLDSWR